MTRNLVFTFFHFTFSDVIAFLARGDVYGWGNNDYGQLGLGPGDYCMLEPRKIPEFSGKNFTHVTCGYDNSFAWVSYLRPVGIWCMMIDPISLQ